MPKKGDIILILFPFTDFSGTKRRPALVIGVSKEHVVVLFITSQQKGEKTWQVAIPANQATGLVVASVIRADKIASVDFSIITGAIGSASAKTMQQVDTLLTKLFKL